MSGAITRHGEMWWPLDDTDARPVIERDVETSITRLLAHFEGRRLIVQAGANVGTYPIALARQFEAVFTVEPDPVNFQCLTRNLAEHDPEHRITAREAAFGAVIGTCAPLEVHPRNCGAHRVAFETGSVRVMTVDGLGLGACDCIWVDVEGSELFALQGAAKTIERFSPVIAAEDKGLGSQFFGLPGGALQAWLSERGYSQVDKIGNDKVFKR